MINKKFWSGLLVMALVFGTAIISCDTSMNNGSGGGAVGITYTVEANGELDKETSTQLEFTFDDPVSNLTLNDITIIAGTGKAAINQIKGNFTGGDKSWKLNITKVTAGKIRVQIDKIGVERGRKTVLVHQNTSPALTKDAAIPLSELLWEDSSIESGKEKWYKFEAEKGTNYCVQWKDSSSKPESENYEGVLKVTIYKSDGESVISTHGGGSWGYTNPKPVEGQSGTVYLKLESGSEGYPVSFAIRYYDSESMGPTNIVQLGLVLTLDGSVTVSLVGSVNEIEKLGGIKVYRSEKEDGAYTEITDITDTSKYTYTDETVTGGKTYWYKVAAYNKKGIEGDPTEPQEIKVPKEVGTPLKFGVYTEGEVISGQVDWYSFTAESGKTYEVQWLGSGSEEGYNGMPMVYAIKSDKETEIDRNYISPVTVSGVSGKVYLKVVSGWLGGTYAIRVVEK